VGGPEADASAAGEARRSWLEKLQLAAERAHDELGDPSDPIVKDLAANLGDLAAHLERELEGPDHAEPDASGIT
jgi:hypothetical protein